MSLIVVFYQKQEVVKLVKILNGSFMKIKAFAHERNFQTKQYTVYSVLKPLLTGKNCSAKEELVREEQCRRKVFVQKVSFNEILADNYIDSCFQTMVTHQTSCISCVCEQFFIINQLKAHSGASIIFLFHLFSPESILDIESIYIDMSQLTF